jgi:hypothetical protein
MSATPKRKHLVQSAAYWFDASRVQQQNGNHAHAILGMENAYNHVENALAAALADLAARDAVIEKLRHLLQRHHQWHLDQTDRTPIYFGDTIGQINADEYAECELGEDTTAILSALAPQDGKEKA